MTTAMMMSHLATELGVHISSVIYHPSSWSGGVKLPHKMIIYYDLFAHACIHARSLYLIGILDCSLD